MNTEHAFGWYSDKSGIQIPTVLSTLILVTIWFKGEHSVLFLQPFNDPNTPSPLSTTPTPPTSGIPANAGGVECPPPHPGRHEGRPSTTWTPPVQADGSQVEQKSAELNIKFIPFDLCKSFSFSF